MYRRQAWPCQRDCGRARRANANWYGANIRGPKSQNKAACSDGICGNYSPTWLLEHMDLRTPAARNVDLRGQSRHRKQRPCSDQILVVADVCARLHGWRAKMA